MPIAGVIPKGVAMPRDFHLWLRSRRSAARKLRLARSTHPAACAPGRVGVPHAYPFDPSYCHDLQSLCIGKPGVLAPGTGIQSAASQSGCSVAGDSGTSFAAPAVAGVATITREYFVRGCYPTGSANASNAFTPSGALLKAALINASQNISGEAGYPGLREGWGRVLGDSALYFSGDSRRLRLLDQSSNVPGALTTAESVTLRVRTAIYPEPLRVTLAFHDAPAAVTAASAAVNDLDLAVQSPAGWSYLGNVFAGGLTTNRK